LTASKIMSSEREVQSLKYKWQKPTVLGNSDYSVIYMSLDLGVLVPEKDS
jgi:hypothetical protein